MPDHSIIRIGTRGSPLALVQAHEVRDRLCKAHHFAQDQIKIEIISTTGDQIQEKALREFGGKGLFTKEIEQALLAGHIDMAVHSMKDVPTDVPDGLSIECVLARGDVRDAFISLTADSLADLPTGARVGTSSLRRSAQLKALRSDLEVVAFRGNVQTRLKKLQEGIADATFLAVAGLNRLGLQAKITAKIAPEDMLPAIAQGAIGIECRLGDEKMISLLSPLHHQQTALEIGAERAFLRKLDGSCRTPIAALAQIKGDQLVFRGEILALDGGEVFRIRASGESAQGEQIAIDCGQQLLNQAGAEFLKSLIA